MKKLKAGFKPGQNQPKTAYNPRADRPERTSSDPTLPNPRPYSGSSSEGFLLDSFPDGVEVLHDRPDATVDICFVHGLTGNRDSTWTAHGQSTPWPKTLLPPKLTRARILTYGYDAYIVRKSAASLNRLIDHATNLLNDLTTDRASRDASSRPLIFVTHSLGGLVCKEAILLSRNNPESHLRGIFDCTNGIVFMGTPHKGSWMADWAKIPASALGLVKSTNKLLLEILETDNQFLESIQVRFWSMIRELREAGRRLEVTCFFEELPLPVVGKVVSKESATLEGYSSFSIHANHRDMVRFGSAEDNGFERLLGELIRWESQIRDSVASQPTRLMEGKVEGPGHTFSNFSGEQFNAPGGTQNIAKGEGNQFPGSTFSGSVQF
ncbi:Alpha/Beta hydrolase protein [Rhexocercosporidium sp. MPI-PUGE-AT-0058]|nr:Alpha/Beta hydrolase protein [Rhexocercosporidium sp. MPI-PUGE-AT-0058]